MWLMSKRQKNGSFKTADGELIPTLEASVTATARGASVEVLPFWASWLRVVELQQKVFPGERGCSERSQQDTPDKERRSAPLWLAGSGAGPAAFEPGSWLAGPDVGG